MTSRRDFLASAACWVPLTGLAQTPSLAVPRGTVLLEVDGAIQEQNASRKVQFDLAMLDALPQTRFVTTTIWTEGALSFSGPTLMSVLEFVGAAAGPITARAANDYYITLASGTVDQNYPILATRKNDLPFTLRDSGPIWLAYPYDSDQKYRNNLIYSQSIWYLVQLHVGVA